MARKRFLVAYAMLMFSFWAITAGIFPYSALYFTETRGMSLAQTSVIWAFFWGSLFLLQIPMGMLADRFGRLRVFALATLLGAGGMYCTSLPLPFAAYAIFLGLFAMSRACQPGVTQAWIVDKADAAGSKDARVSIAVIGEYSAYGGVFLGQIGGGAVATYWNSYAMPFAVSGMLLCVFGVILGIATMGQANRPSHSAVKDFRVLAKEARDAIRREPALLRVFCIGIILAVSFGSAGILYWPVYFKEYFEKVSPMISSMLPAWMASYVSPKGLPALLSALFGACGLGGVALAQTLSKKGKTSFHVLAGTLICYGACYLVLGLTAGHYALSLVCFTIMFTLCGSFSPMTSDMLNRFAPEAVRATILSVNAASFCIGVIIGQLGAGWGITHLSYGILWTSVAIVTGLSMAYCLRSLRTCLKNAQALNE